MERDGINGQDPRPYRPEDQSPILREPEKLCAPGDEFYRRRGARAEIFADRSVTENPARRPTWSCGTLSSLLSWRPPWPRFCFRPAAYQIAPRQELVRHCAKCLL